MFRQGNGNDTKLKTFHNTELAIRNP